MYVSGGGTLAFAPQVLGVMTYLGGSAFVIAKGYSDTKNNTNSNLSEYLFEGIFGATRGLISLIAFGYAAEIGIKIGLTNLEIILAGGYASGTAGSCFEQLFRTGNVDLEQLLGEAITEGVLGVLGYGIGKAVSQVIKQGKNAVSKIISQNSNKTASVADDVVNAVDDVADDIANKVDESVKVIDDVVEGGLNSNNPQSYLDRALKNQGLDGTPAKMKEVWTEGDYKYTVRIHEGNATYTDAESIYRVSRKSTVINGQGSGMEYLGTDGNWYSERVLKEFYKDGSKNPLFNENASKITHISVGGN